MKHIQIATSHNILLKLELIKSGYSITEYDLPLSNENIEEINKQKSQYLVLEIEDSSIAALDELNTSNKKIVFLAKALTEKTRKALHKKGIANLLPGDDPKRIINYLAVLESKHKQGIAPLLILEDNSSIKTILHEIIERFNFRPLFVKSCEDIYEAIATNNDIQLILINLGHHKLNLKKLILKVHANLEIKKIPIIAYKDMNTGLFVHELITGLNKVTKYIFSIDELFSILVEILFKKEIYPLIQKLNKKVDVNNNSLYANNLLNQIFKQENNLFSEITLLQDKSLLDIINITNEIKNTSIKADGLKWLRMNYNLGNDFTCEVGV